MNEGISVKVDDRGLFAEIDDIVNNIRRSKTEKEAKIKMQIWFMTIVRLGTTVGNVRFVMNDPINREYYSQIIHPFIQKCDETMANKLMKKPTRRTKRKKRK